jgi:hypothetical protein
MNINDYYMYRLSQERMKKNLQEAERQQLVKLARPENQKPHRMAVLLAKIKKILQDLFSLHGQQTASRRRETGSLKKSGST